METEKIKIKFEDLKKSIESRILDVNSRIEYLINEKTCLEEMKQKLEVGE